MPEEHGRSKSPLELLPTELHISILSALEDMRSLGSAILSCRSLYNTFSSNESYISLQILRNQIDDAVLPEATAAFASSWLPNPVAKSDVLTFIATHLHTRNLSPLSIITSSQAASAARLNGCVHKFTQLFIDTCFAKLPANDSPNNLSVHPLASQTEKVRIKRAFYRFETFCNLPRQTSRYRDSNYVPIVNILRPFSPWEVEQIACIHDFLYNKIAPLFNEIAKHDITWGNSNVEPATWVGNAGVQAILSDGLEKVYEVITASSYDVRYNLLTKNNHPRHLYNFLHRALGAVIMQTVDLIESPTLSVDDRITYIQPAFFEDPDPGPVDIWEWAHQQEPRMRFVYKVNRASLREWGYVIWDRVQLDALQILGSPWQTPADHFREEVPEMAGERWIESWNERMKIYQNKGRGWWDFGDESKIVWPPGCGPNAPKTRAPKSGSLAAAKAAIHSLTRRISRR